MKGEQMQEKEIQNGFEGVYRVNFFFEEIYRVN